MILSLMHDAWTFVSHWGQQASSRIYAAWARHRQRQVQRELEARYGHDWLEKLTR